MTQANFDMDAAIQARRDGKDLMGKVRSTHSADKAIIRWYAQSIRALDAANSKQVRPCHHLSGVNGPAVLRKKASN